MIKSLRLHLVAIMIIQVILCILYGYHKTYDKRPFSIHQWRQTDCLSITKNYYEEGMHFFQPKIHWQGSIEGAAVSEFPVINYTVACLWKVFGKHEYLYRLLVLSLYILSLLFLFVMVYVTSTSILYSYFATLIVSTSPLLAYYSFSFLADVPALSFAIISLSLFFIYVREKKQNLLLLSILCGTLAVLLKASSATVLLIIGLTLCLHLLKGLKEKPPGKKWSKPDLIPFLALLLSGIVIMAWYRWAVHYNHESRNGVFLMEALPIWNMTDKVIETARSLYNLHLSMYFNKGVLLALSLCALWLLLHVKALPSYLQISLIISIVSFISFIILFFQVFSVHDYYLINTMILPITILVCFGDYLKHQWARLVTKKVMAFLLMIFCINAIYCASVVRLRNSENDLLTHFYPFISSDEKNISDRYFKSYATTIKPLESITPYLRSLGINRNDRVISLPDNSFNVTLYLMDQKGFTLGKKALKMDSTKLEDFRAQGAKYLILSDTTLLTYPTLNKYTGHKLGLYKHVAIYKL